MPRQTKRNTNFLQFPITRQNVVLIILMVIVFALWFIEQFQIAILNTEGVIYSSTRSTASQLDLQNVELKDQLLYEESFAVIQQKAYALGFRPMTSNSIYYVYPS